MQGGNLKQRRRASAGRWRKHANGSGGTPLAVSSSLSGDLPTLQASNLQSMGVAKPEGARRYLLVGSVAGGQSQVGSRASSTKRRGGRERARRQREPAASARGPHRDRNAHSYTRSHPLPRRRPVGSKNHWDRMSEKGLASEKVRSIPERCEASPFSQTNKAPSDGGPGGAHGTVGTACQRGPCVAAPGAKSAGDPGGVGRWSPPRVWRVAS